MAAGGLAAAGYKGYSMLSSNAEPKPKTKEEVDQMKGPDLDKQLDALLRENELTPELRRMLTDEQKRDLIRVKQEERKTTGTNSLDSQSDAELDAQLPPHLKHVLSSMTRKQKIDVIQGMSTNEKMQAKRGQQKNDSVLTSTQRWVVNQFIEGGTEALKPTILVGVVKGTQAILFIINAYKQQRRAEQGMAAADSKDAIDFQIDKFQRAFTRWNATATKGTLTFSDIALVLEAFMAFNRLCDQALTLTPAIGAIVGNIMAHMFWYKTMAVNSYKGYTGNREYLKSQLNGITENFEFKLKELALEAKRTLAAARPSTPPSAISEAAPLEDPTPLLPPTSGSSGAA